MLKLFTDVTQEKAVCGKKIKKKGSEEDFALGEGFFSERVRPIGAFLRCLYARYATKFPSAEHQ